MSNPNNIENDKKIFISHEDINIFQEDILNFEDLPKINKSTFEINNY